MPAPKGKKTPSLRKHKPTGQAVVTIDAKDYYLGKHGSETARATYDQLIAEWLANGRRLPPAAARRVDCTVNELVLAYWRHAQAYYVKDGEPTGEVSNVRDALRPLRRLYGRSSAQDFGPGNLKTVREAMIKAGLSRPVVNARVNRIRRAFKWGVEEEMIPPSVLHSLQAVAPLKRGRTVAREPEPVCGRVT